MTTKKKLEIRSLTVGVPVPNLDEATEWYRKLLGERNEINPAPGVREFEVLSECWLQLFEFRNTARSESIFRMGITDIARQHERISNLGIEPSPIETVPGVVRYFNFCDPYGNRLGFYQVL